MEKQVKVSTQMSGKMKGIWSISTSCKANTFCQKRKQIEGSICSHCFAQSTLSRYKNARKVFENNLEILTSRILSEDELPLFATQLGRIESFGDVQNVTQAVNYIHIIAHNPNTHFAIWSKNSKAWTEAFRQEGKPNNCTFVWSSLFVNTQSKVPQGLQEFCDHIFTVYDKKYVAANAVEINCGARSCLTCQKCYHKGTAFEIREQLK